MLRDDQFIGIAPNVCHEPTHVWHVFQYICTSILVYVNGEYFEGQVHILNLIFNGSNGVNERLMRAYFSMHVLMYRYTCIHIVGVA